jgi:mannose-6-phosphate isomerase-like protein (cupin superfamily)
MHKSATNDAKTSNYHVKNIEPVMVGSGAQARLFTLAPGETIPWHYHHEATDHSFVLGGELTVLTRAPEEGARTLGIGSEYRIAAATSHVPSDRQPLRSRMLVPAAPGREI